MIKEAYIGCTFAYCKSNYSFSDIQNDTKVICFKYLSHVCMDNVINPRVLLDISEMPIFKSVAMVNILTKNVEK